jgi:hypothetical protein
LAGRGDRGGPRAGFGALGGETAGRGGARATGEERPEISEEESAGGRRGFAWGRREAVDIFRLRFLVGRVEAVGAWWQWQQGAGAWGPHVRGPAQGRRFASRARQTRRIRRLPRSQTSATGTAKTRLSLCFFF